MVKYWIDSGDSKGYQEILKIGTIFPVKTKMIKNNLTNKYFSSTFLLIGKNLWKIKIHSIKKPIL